MTFTGDDLSDFWVQSYELAQLTAELRGWIADDIPTEDREIFDSLDAALLLVGNELFKLWQTTAHDLLTKPPEVEPC